MLFTSYQLLLVLLVILCGVPTFHSVSVVPSFGFGAMYAQPLTKPMHKRLIDLLPLVDAHMEDLHYIRGTTPSCDAKIIVSSCGRELPKILHACFDTFELVWL